jgi:hypothetical protein
VVRKWKGNSSGNGMDLGRNLEHKYGGKANRQCEVRSRASEEVR